MPETKQSILIVDDTEINLDMLLAILSDDYTVRVATDGASALRSVKKTPPDIILLDVIMPGMNGFEICRDLKADAGTQNIPVIFVTSLSQEMDEAHGLNLGAVDYITKPFNPAIVRARIQSHLELKRYRDHLERRVEIRTRELTDANGRLMEIDAARKDFLHAISHELRTPLNGIMGIGQLAISDLPDPKQQAEYSALFNHSAKRLMETVDNAMLMASLLENDSITRIRPIDLNEILKPLVNASGTGTDGHHPVRMNFPEKARPIMGTEEMIKPILTTMFRVAQVMAYPDSEIGLDITENEKVVILTIRLVCRPVPENLQHTFFDIFSHDRTRSCLEDLGLAIPLAAHMIRAIGGKAMLGSTPDGVEFNLHFLKTAG